MKKFICVMTVLFALSGITCGQDKGPSFRISYQGSNYQMNNPDNSPYLRTVSLAGLFGYNVNSNFFIGITLEGVTGLFEHSGTRTYQQASILGVAGSYNIATFKKIAIDVAASIGNTLDNRMWNFIYYDAGLRFNSVSDCPVNMYLGLGVRYSQSHNSNFRNYLNLYGSWGFRFN